ncbi:MAG: DMT family transporter [Pseudanabaena sp. ELA607]
MFKPFFQQIPGRVYLLLAILIFAAANPISSKLTALGAQNLINGRNPISLCNVLFVGNLCALILMLLMYGRELSLKFLQRITRRHWFYMFLVAVIGGALAPALFFTALSLTPVNNVILISRIEPPLILALSVLLLGESVNIWVLSGSLIAFIGVSLTVLLPLLNSGNSLQIGRGDWMTLGGAVAAAIATVISKSQLSQISLGISSLFRLTVATIIFFTAATYLFGWEHFADVATPFLWQWMLIYSAIIVVGGQWAWFSGLRKASTSEISLVSSFSPIAGILATYLILGDAPTMSQYIGGAVILIGIVFSQIGTADLQAKQRQEVLPASGAAMDEVGYKGI